jgi:hypothetical protein
MVGTFGRTSAISLGRISRRRLRLRDRLWSLLPTVHIRMMIGKGKLPTPMNRRDFPKAVKIEVLTKCRRRCALCFALEGDIGTKRGQLAHIDRNPANSSKENAAFLCTQHHDEYDSTSRQTAGIAAAELKKYQESLYEYLESPGIRLDARGRPRKRKTTNPKTISFELYDRRLPIYRIAIQFLRVVQRDYKPNLQEVLKFAGDTEEALFLFDETIAAYLAELLKKALRLRAVTLSLERHWSDSAGQEDAELTAWFSAQFEDVRAKFARYLRPRS